MVAPLRKKWVPLGWCWALLLFGMLLLFVLPFLLFDSLIEDQARSLLAQRSRAILAPAIAAALALDVLLPIPSSLLSTAAGAVLGFMPALLTCWAGMTVGCLLGYWIGATGGTVIVRRLLGEGEAARATRLATSVGTLTLVLARAVPVLAEASTVAAGLGRLPLLRFLVVVGLANLGIATAYAAIGAFAYEINSFLIVFFASVGIPALGWTVRSAGMRLSARFGSRFR